MPERFARGPVGGARSRGAGIRSLIGGCVTIGALAGMAGAQSPRATVPLIDPGVYELMTGGYWKNERQSGTIRVVVLMEGWEAIRHRMFVQWIEERSEAHEARLVATREVADVVSNCYSLVSPSLSLKGGRWILVAKASSAPMKRTSQNISIVLGAPGELTPLKHCTPAPLDG